MVVPTDISIEISLVDRDVMLVEVTTPVGRLTILGNVVRIGRVLHIGKAHVDGLKAGVLGRDGLNMIGRKFLEEADVDQIVIEGGARTTGRGRGRIPKIIRFPHSSFFAGSGKPH